MSSQSRKVLGATFFYSLGEIIPRILAFLLLPILTRYLSAEEYGINSYITSVMTFVFVIAALSLNTYVLRNYFLESDDDARKKLVGNIFATICLFNVVLLLIELLLIPLALKTFDVKIPFYPFFLLGVVNNFFDVISIIPLVLYRVKGNTKGFFILSTSRIVFQYVLTYILVVLFKQGLIGTFYARLLVNLPFGVLYFIIISRYAPIRFNYKRFRDALTFSLPLIPGSISYLIFSISDRIILERFVGLAEIGIYSVAVTITLALNVVIQALYKTIEPLLFKAYTTPDFLNVNAKMYKYYLLLVYTGGFGISIFSKEIFHFVGSRAFQVGANIVPAMVLSVILSGVTLYLNTVLVAEGRQKIISVAIVVSAIVSIMLNFLLIPHMGYYGAVVASLLASLSSNIIAHSYARFPRKLLWQQFILLAVIFLTPYLLVKYISLESILAMIACKAIIVILFAYIGLLLLDCNLKKDWQLNLFQKI
ncbi:oligosaccharide flippase family protein [Chitinophaga ginsengisegetis]|uniref:oligosaccharide flippase family protein n=1 Tax=Chitinophaga ginsengisegetis TaxID=393003 RepID=UPI00344715EE